MFTRTLTIFLVGTLLLLPHKAATQNKTVYKSTGNEATLTGFVTIKGQSVEPRRIDMTADPVCMEGNYEGYTEYVVRNGDKLANVLVYFKSGEALRLLSFEAPTTPALLRRRNCRFSPRVIGVRVNQELNIENNDATYHNTHPTPKINPEFNRSQPPYTPPMVTKFEVPEVAIPFKCNQHPWEKAYVAVFDHPFFATSDAFGRYEIKGIPPGKYQIVAWHETLGEQEMEITLVPGEVRSVDFLFAGNSK